jgi:antitoxin HicB
MPIGSSFDEFLEEECIREETELKAIKEVLSWKLQQAMKENHLSKSDVAKSMKCSHSTVERVLDPNNVSIKLKTAVKTANACELRLSLQASAN